MILHQPNDKLGIGFIKEVALTKQSRINRTKFRVITTSSFANIVVKRATNSSRGFAIAAQFAWSQEIGQCSRLSRTPAIGDDLHCVRINGVGVEHIELHLPHNFSNSGK